jgi:hypothetical protein
MGIQYTITEKRLMQENERMRKGLEKICEYSNWQGHEAIYEIAQAALGEGEEENGK